MFKVGDKVVYQVHGIGEIISVEERVIADKKEDYYIVQIEETKITVMVPVNNAKEVGLRR
jgi:CarD family transcriptional regulator